MSAPIPHQQGQFLVSDPNSSQLQPMAYAAPNSQQPPLSNNYVTSAQVPPTYSYGPVEVPHQQLQQIVHPQAVPQQQLHPQAVPQQQLHPQAVPQQQIHPQAVPQQQLHPQAVPQQQIHPQAVPQQQLHPQAVPQQQLHPQAHAVAPEPVSPGFESPSVTLSAEVGGPDVPISCTPGHRIMVGLGWDFALGQPPVDLDCSVLCFNSAGILLDAAYYNQTIALSNAIRHSGDSKDGRGDGFDEHVTVSLEKIPPVVEVLMFVVNAHRGGSMRDVENATATVVELPLHYGKPGFEQLAVTPMATCALKCKRAESEGTVFCLLFRNGSSGWFLRNVSRVCGGKNFQESLPEAKEALAASGLLSLNSTGAISMDRTFNMKKGDFVEIPSHLFTHGSDLFVGLGWEANNRRGHLDLDASIILLDQNSNKIDVVNYGNRQFLGGTIYHRGDNTTGIGKGDDERIDIDLDRLPVQVQSLFVVVNVYNTWGSFGDVRDAYIRLVACRNQHEFCRFRLEGSLEGAPCLLFCKIFRSPCKSTWLMQSIGLGCEGRVATQQAVLDGIWAVEGGDSRFGNRKLVHKQECSRVQLVNPRVDYANHLNGNAGGPGYHYNNAGPGYGAAAGGKKKNKKKTKICCFKVDLD